MRRWFMYFLALFFPWIAMFLKDNPGGALLTAVLQASIVGWLPASIWAWRVVSEDEARHKKPKRKAKPKEKEEKEEEEETSDVAPLDEDEPKS